MAEPSRPLRRFLSELRRRHVFRVGAVYAAVAFVLVQAAELVFPALLLPPVAQRVLVVLALFGFPIALVLAWAFEVTPEGVRRTEPVEAAAAEPGEAGGDGDGGRETARAGLWLGAGILVALVGVGAYAALGGDESAAPERGERSVAVLPFQDMSAGEDQTYFADGITEDILTRLARVAGLRVISRTSVMRYRGSDLSVPEIAEELDVRHVLEGSVRRVGDQVRISAQLIDATTDAHLWAETYDRRVSDVFAIQAEIASRIADALEVRLSEGERERLRREEGPSPEAYDLYLRGREYFYRPYGSVAGLRSMYTSAIAFFRQALEEDPGYAPAWAGLARAHRGLPDLSAGAAYDSAVAFARNAISADPDLADGYVELGLAYRLVGQREAAMEQLRYAEELNPNHGRAVAGIARLHRAGGRHDRALEAYRRAVKLDPGDRELHAEMGLTAASLGLFGRAEERIRASLLGSLPQPTRAHCHLGQIAHLRGDPASVRTHLDSLLALAGPEETFGWWCSGILASYLGDFEFARSQLERFVATLPDGRDPVDARPELVHATFESGRTEEARQLLERLVERASERIDEAPEDDGAWLALAAARTLQGRPDAAMEALRAAVDHGYRGYYELRAHPVAEGLRGRDDFQRLLDRLKAEVDSMRALVVGEAAGAP